MSAEDSVAGAAAAGTGSPGAETAHLAPVSGRERSTAVDTLRGVALLGILPMNIYAFAMPVPAYANPLAYGGLGTLDLATWVVTHLLADQKFMTLFSLLFGAGLILMDERAGGQDARLRVVHYRRQLWLLLIGAAHAYLLWFGDILFHYALMGLWIFLLRRRSPRTLIVVGGVLILVGALVGTGMGVYLAEVRRVSVEAEGRLAAGLGLEPQHRQARADWDEMRAFLEPSAEDIAREVRIHRAGYTAIVGDRVPLVFLAQTFLTLAVIVWRVGGLMLVGMGLMKLRVFSAERSDRFYRGCVALGYGLGLPLAALSAHQLSAHGFDTLYTFRTGGHYNYFASIGVAFGHLGVVMLVCRSGRWAAARERLAAVGRMALTHYLAHSLILTSVFYGYGLGLFGQVGRFAQMGFVLAVWALQLAWSPLWLGRYRFGPFEWLWRSLTYGRLQPLRKAG